MLNYKKIKKNIFSLFFALILISFNCGIIFGGGGGGGDPDSDGDGISDADEKANAEKEANSAKDKAKATIDGKKESRGFWGGVKDFFGGLFGIKSEEESIANQIGSAVGTLASFSNPATAIGRSTISGIAGLTGEETSTVAGYAGEVAGGHKSASVDGAMNAATGGISGAIADAMN